MPSIREKAMQGSGKARGAVTTTNATATDLNPSGGVLALPNNSAYHVTARIIGRRTDTGSEVGVYTVVAGVKRGVNAASTALVAAVTKTVIAEDTVAWDATLVADTTAGGIKAQVTGEASKTISWVAQFSYVKA